MINVQNIYYMLAYAFQNLNSRDEKKYSVEEFEYTADLFASMLANGVTKQIKRGLAKEYIPAVYELASPRGRICIADTIQRMSQQKKTTVCELDEYVENTYMNGILKTVMLQLIASDDVRHESKVKLKRLLLHFQNVDSVDVRHVNWNKIQFNKNNSNYRMLMYICKLIIDGMLIGKEGDTLRLKEFVDDQQMYSLYEKFILEFYKRHYPQVKVTQSQIEWNLDNDVNMLLPRMRSDIMLEYHGKTLIIDAKYYNKALSTNTRYGNHTVHSSNLYQIYAYVKNKDSKSDKSVSGMLLYANTDGTNPDIDYMMDGNKISVKTLDLNCDFQMVKKQLDDIISDWAHYYELAI